MLAHLGLPAAQQHDRSALVLLCLLDLTPDRGWSDADGRKLWQTYVLMQWLRDHYDKDYNPNSRETIRRQTLHQFVDAGLVLCNPDDPQRAVNSSRNCYQIAPVALALLRTHDDQDFDDDVQAYLASPPGLTPLYAQQPGLELPPRTPPAGPTVGPPRGRPAGPTPPASADLAPSRRPAAPPPLHPRSNTKPYCNRFIRRATKAPKNDCSPSTRPALSPWTRRARSCAPTPRSAP